jgi:hypothetical protein
MNHNQQLSLVGYSDDNKALFVDGAVWIRNRD